MGNITDIEVIENMIQTNKFQGLKMKRINFNGYRLYINDDPFAYYSGLTGALSNCTFKGDPDEKRLKGWREGMIDSFGAKNASDYVAMTADFGTLLHMALLIIKERGEVNWDEEKDRAYNYFINAYKDKQIEPDYKVIKQQSYDYCKHVSSLLQFCHDRVQEIYAVETPAIHEELKICTPIDMFCLCKSTDKGEFKPTTINLKTSSQISNHQMDQVACEMVLWNKTYEMKAENTAILRTKDWAEKSGIPTYEYKWMDSVEAGTIFTDVAKRLWLCLNSSASYFPNPINKSFKGITKLGEKPEIVTTTLQEEWEEVKKSFEEELPII